MTIDSPDSKIRKLQDIADLTPPFANGYGWLSIAELNVIDPDAARFEIIDEAEFEDGSIFVLIEPS